MLKIIKYPNEILRQRSMEIDRHFVLSEETKNLIAEMEKIMQTDNGVGLAAPQIGKNIRLTIISKEAVPDKKENLVLINPEWEKTSRKKIWGTEGCLSVPLTFGKVKRYKEILVKAMDKKGRRVEFKATDFFARVIQHEIDHLDGELFIDKAKDLYQVEQKN
jgi:peptide deformylase